MRIHDPDYSIVSQIPGIPVSEGCTGDLTSHIDPITVVSGTSWSEIIDHYQYSMGKQKSVTALEAACTLGVTAALALMVSYHVQRRHKQRSSLPFSSGQEATASMFVDQESHAPYHHERLSLENIQQRAKEFRHLLEMRRSVRFYSKASVPRSVMEDIIATAATSPSGAHKQPWHFSLVGSIELKQKIRSIVEEEEQVNYNRRMKQTWIDDLKGMMSDLHKDVSKISKPYLTEAPWLIVVSKQMYGADNDGNKISDHYYVPESVGIACGFLVAAIHNANLVTVTSTPMGAYSRIAEELGRPSNEKVFLLLPVGFPSTSATVPYRTEPRKPIRDVMTVY